MSVFAASDIVEVAIRIEENGVNFYKFAEQIAKQEEAKKLFAQLAQAEVEHKKTFEKLFANMEKNNPPESYEGEFGAYLRSYVDNNLIFTKEIMDKQLAKIKDTVSALDFAIQRELDSILYYHEIKKLVPAAQHDVIEKIIEEERKHFLSLTAMKKSSTC
ncbi:MAG: ferritin family protein [Deltaproteobacteria bacterium]|nr:ferritin family protein [Deltaproteobacteria bacterium]